MRSLDRFKQRYKSGTQPTEKSDCEAVNKIVEEDRPIKGVSSRGLKAEEEKAEDFDFIVSGEKKTPSKSFPIFRQENPNETPVERFERFNRQLGCAICACSLCPRGLKDFQVGNIITDPHKQPSIWHKEIMLLKYEPEDIDQDKLFGNLKHDLDLDDFYCTTVIKCAGEGKADCPFFKLELKSLIPVMPKAVVVFDERSAKMFNADFESDKIQKFGKSKIICCHSEKRTKAVISLLANQETRSRLLS